MLKRTHIWLDQLLITDLPLQNLYFKLGSKSNAHPVGGSGIDGSE